MFFLLLFEHNYYTQNQILQANTIVVEVVVKIKEFEVFLNINKLERATHVAIKIKKQNKKREEFLFLF